MKKVAIIGGGCSAVIVALHLLRQRQNSCAIEILDPNDSVGLGVAYGTKDPLHCLNVPAERMGVFTDKHDDFLVWLQERELQYQKGDFVPRVLYGEYLQTRLAEYSNRVSPVSSICHRKDLAVSVSSATDKGRWRVALNTGAESTYDEVVLAIGLPEGGWPNNIDGFQSAIAEEPSRYVENVWSAPFAEDDGQEIIGVLGTGLSAIDVTLSLLSRDPHAKVVLISRHGLLPSPHFTTIAPPVPKERAQFSGSLREVTRKVHTLLLEYRWDAVIDSLRSYTPSLWSAFSEEDRQRFLRHFRHTWDVHRHRMAPHIWKQISDWRESGRIEVVQGRISNISNADGKVKIGMIRRTTSSIESIEVDKLYNCTGFRSFSEGDYGGLLAQMERDAIITLDSTRTGICPRPALSLCLQPGLYVIGAILRAIRWESIAVPELRQQGAEIAELITKNSTHPET